MNTTQISPSKQQVFPQTLKSNEASFPLPSGSAYIRLPNQMTEQDKTMLFAYLDTWKAFIVCKKEEGN